MKKRMKKLLFSFSLSFLLFFFSFGHVLAAGEFSTSYEVTYEALEEGVMQVTQNISLENKLSNVYATQYSLIFEGKPVKNIKAQDSQGELKVTTSEETGKISISLEFNQKVVGKGETLNFSVSYESGDLVQKSGQIWEVIVPKLAKPEEIEKYSLTLKVPLSFGSPAFISPKPLSSGKASGKRLFHFSKNQIASSGVVAAFGQFQVFDFSLSYHLENKRVLPIKTQIAIPPDTNYQKLSYRQISPEPENVIADEDGNWLAEYHLGPTEKLDVHVLGQAKIFTREKNNIFSKSEGLERYLFPQEFWEQDEQIKNLASALKTPEKIYQYVIKTLNYDYSRVREGAKRMGAAKILRNPERAICTEYTDLFIALCRAAGIPARELNGYAYTTNPFLQPLSLVQDILHSWPEYWDESQKAWIQVDPTWQNTTGGVDYFKKLDLGHFAFVIHGQDSTYPPPAGSYKLPGTVGKDVVIAFGQYQEREEEFTLEESLPSEISAERKASGKLKIFNLGTEAIYNLPLKASLENLTLFSDVPEKIEVLPPFAKVEIPLSFKAQKFSLQGLGKIIVFAGGERFEYNIRIKSYLLALVLPIFGVLLALLVIYFLAGRLRRILARREKNEDFFPNKKAS